MRAGTAEQHDGDRIVSPTRIHGEIVSPSRIPVLQR